MQLNCLSGDIISGTIRGAGISLPISSPLKMNNVLTFSCVTMGTCVYTLQVGGCIDDLLRINGRCARSLKEGLVLIYDTKLHEWAKGPNLPLGAIKISTKDPSCHGKQFVSSTSSH